MNRLPAGQRQVGLARLAALAAVVVFAVPALSSEPFSASGPSIALDREIDWSRARLIAVQDGGRYKTLDSFAREMMTNMYGKESLPGLSPLGSVCDWLFRRDAYAESPVVYIREKGLRIHFSSHMSDAVRQRVVQHGYMTPIEFSDATVRQRISELEGGAATARAINRARDAQIVVNALEQLIRLSPHPVGDHTQRWHTPDELRANLPDELLAAGGVTRAAIGPPIPDVTAEYAMSVLGPWARLRMAWINGDAPAVQTALDDLAEVLPTLAAPNVYPSESQRNAETRYYAMGKFNWGYWLYALATIISIWALVTSWRVPWILALLANAAALSLHSYALGLRWSILGRIPVANMYEAVVASAAGGVAIALLLELIYRRRVFLVGSGVIGFLALVFGAYLIPGAGNLASIMGILDDVMLRIHTVLIILSYALIALAAVIAILYLFGYYLVRAPQQSSEAGVMILAAGAAVWIAMTSWIYTGPVQVSGAPQPIPNAPIAFMIIAAAALVLMPLVRVLPRWAHFHGFWFCGLVAFCGGLIGFMPYGFTKVMAMIMGIGGFVWVIATLIGYAAMRRAWSSPSPAQLRLERPLLAGGAPGDEGQASRLPAWLHHFDWCHLIILNMVFVMLFVGIILGAVWADYSWGRPWGWDPKEVFALNTWIIYAILMHVRFITTNRGLWTAWLSVSGCLMMAFNWCFVNFFIVGMHSYA